MATVQRDFGLIADENGFLLGVKALAKKVDNIDSNVEEILDILKQSAQYQPRVINAQTSALNAINKGIRQVVANTQPTLINSQTNNQTDSQTNTNSSTTVQNTISPQRTRDTRGRFVGQQQQPNATNDNTSEGTADSTTEHNTQTRQRDANGRFTGGSANDSGNLSNGLKNLANTLKNGLQGLNSDTQGTDPVLEGMSEMGRVMSPMAKLAKFSLMPFNALMRRKKRNEPLSNAEERNEREKKKLLKKIVDKIKASSSGGLLSGLGGKLKGLGGGLMRFAMPLLSRLFFPITALATAFFGGYKLGTIIYENFGKWIDSLKKSDLVKKLTGVFADTWEGIKRSFGSVWNSITGVWDDIKKNFNSVIEKIGGIFSDIKSSVTNGFNNAWDAAKEKLGLQKDTPKEPIVQQPRQQQNSVLSQTQPTVQQSPARGNKPSITDAQTQPTREKGAVEQATTNNKNPLSWTPFGWAMRVWGKKKDQKHQADQAYEKKKQQAGVVQSPRVGVVQGTSSQTAFNQDASNAKPQKQSFSAFIGKGEGDYNSVNLGEKYKYHSAKRDLTKMTVAEVMQRQKNYEFNAAGKFQIIRDTMPSVIKGMGLTGKELFNEEMQERMGAYLAFTKRPELGNYLTGKSNDLNAAGNAAAREWASLPVFTDLVTKVGKKTYHAKAGSTAYTDGVNKASHSIADTKRVTESARATYLALKAQGLSDSDAQLAAFKGLSTQVAISNTANKRSTTTTNNSHIKNQIKEETQNTTTNTAISNQLTKQHNATTQVTNPMSQGVTIPSLTKPTTVVPFAKLQSSSPQIKQQAIPEIEPLNIPTTSPKPMLVQNVGNAVDSISQNLSDRALAHLVTGGLGESRFVG